MKKFIILIAILVFTFPSAAYSTGTASVVPGISGTRKTVAVSFSEDVINAEAELYLVTKDRISFIKSESYYNTADNILIIELGNELSIDSKYELKIRYGEALENKYSTYFMFRILKSFDEPLSVNSDFTVVSLKDEKEVYSRYRNYTVEFELEKQAGSAVSVAFYANKNYSMNWNYHSAYGITLSSNPDLWSYRETSEPLSEEVFIEADASGNADETGAVKVSASVLGNHLLFGFSDSVGNELYSLKAELSFDSHELKYNYGTFGISSEATAEINNLICYKLEAYYDFNDEAQLHNIDFIKNADTIAETDMTATVTVKDADGNTVLNDDGSEKTISVDYAEIDMETWFNGMPGSKYGMYFSGLKSKLFPIDGNAEFARVYREDTVENGEVTESKYIASDTESYEMKFETSGYAGKMLDSFVLINEEGKDYHAPELTADLYKVPTSSVRFAAQTNSSVLTVKVRYTDGTEQAHNITTGLHGNIVYSSYWKNFHKYFAKEDEEVTAGIIGQYIKSNGTAIYPYNYKTIYDYAAVDTENTASGDIRYKDKGIRYYNPRLFLFEVKTDNQKIAESVTFSVSNSNPTAIYSIAQREFIGDKFLCRDYEKADNYVSVQLIEENINYKNYVPFFAVYDEKGKLLGVSAEVTDGVMTVNCSGNEADFAYVMFWSKGESMKPLGEKINLK